MGVFNNINQKEENIDSQILNNNEFLTKGPKKLNIIYNNKIYFFLISKVSNDNYIYIKIYEKDNSFHNIYYHNLFNKQNIFFINKYFNSDNTINNSYNNLCVLIEKKLFNLKYNIDGNTCKLSFFKENNENSSELILRKKFIPLSQVKFEINPNLKYKSEILKTNTSFGCNNIFEIFFSYKKNQVYLISPNINSNNLDIISLADNKKITSLKGHEFPIISTRYFINDDKEFLISSDDGNIVIVWDLSNIENNIINKIGPIYNFTHIYSCYILFNIFNKDLIYVSTSNCSNNNQCCSKIYLLYKNIFIKNIKDTNNYQTLYVLKWINNVIEFCFSKIIIYSIIDSEKYCELKSDNEFETFFHGIIFNENFLISGSDGDFIRIWDLNKKIMINSIITAECCITYINKWNDNYIIVADHENNEIKIIDMKQLKIITNIRGESKVKNTKNIICVKKFYHKVYGESLLVAEGDGLIKLYSKQI